MECYAEQYAQKGLITARKLAKQVLTIPLYEQLKQEQMNRILELICLGRRYVYLGEQRNSYCISLGTKWQIPLVKN